MDVTTWVLIAWIGVCLVFMARQKTEKSLVRLERKLDALLDQAGIDIGGRADREALALLQAGKKVEAVRAYQEYTGASLDVAARHVEGLRKSAGGE